MRHLATVLVLFISFSLFAADVPDMQEEQSGELLNLHVRARADWQGDWDHAEMNDEHSGFKVKYLMMRLDGTILPGLTYSWRQRLSRKIRNGNMLDATDWLYVRYAIDRWSFSGGKELVALGGWEYDRNPVDLYCYSVFWQNTPSFEYGASVGYDITPKDNLTLQVTQSIWHTADQNNLYCYNLLWTGKHGPLSAIWSANMAEYAKGRFISYISLGNRIDVGGVYLELDLMNRAASHQTFFFRDCSVMSDFGFNTPNRKWRFHAKLTYDVNKTGSHADLAVLPGTELTMAGGGVEFFPLKQKRKSLRLHAACYHSRGCNTEESDIMQSGTTLFSVGVSWDMNLLTLHRKR